MGKLNTTTSLLLVLLFTHLGCKTIKEKSGKNPNYAAVEIPFELTPFNNIKIKTILNGIDTLDLKFDTGTTGLLLTHDAIKTQTHLLNDNNDATPTQNYVKLKRPASLQIGELEWENLDVYPVQHSGQETDGRFGWDLFKGKVVTIDYDRMIFTVSHALPDISEYTKTKLIKTKSVLSIKGKLNVNGKSYKGNFLLDTGYQKSLLLDSLTLHRQDFPTDLKVVEVTKLRNGAGDIFITKVVELPELNIGGKTISNVETQVLNTSNPAGFETHFLGNELLKEFNIILDLQEMDIYLNENG